MMAPPETVTFVLRRDANAYPVLEAGASAKGTSATARVQRELRTLRRDLALDAHPELTVALVDDELRLTLPRAVLQATSR